jgi:hypothetical protein
MMGERYVIVDELLTRFLVSDDVLLLMKTLLNSIGFCVIVMDSRGTQW